jgi:DNA replication protein DnaC
MELSNFDFDKMKPKKVFVNCFMHGPISEALLNGNCRQCKEDAEAKQHNDDYQSMIMQKKRDSGVPERFLEFTLANYPVQIESQATLIKTLSDYDFKHNVVLLGKVGTGKTRIGCSLVDKAVSKKLSAYYSKYYQLTRLAIDDKTTFKRISNVDFLVIDEFGVSDTDYKTQLLFELFDQRYDAMKATMLITNLSVKQLHEKIGDALYSRIKQDCVSFKCDWEDYRLKGDK